MKEYTTVPLVKTFGTSLDWIQSSADFSLSHFANHLLKTQATHQLIFHHKFSAWNTVQNIKDSVTTTMTSNSTFHNNITNCFQTVMPYFGIWIYMENAPKYYDILGYSTS